jgi:D-glycero-alpha-D-manno-heptose 1-phosphate guanylyltransferase
MIKEAIILAGGLGTRLRSVVSDVPKCMALIGGKPFLHYLIEFLKKNGIEHFIFSVGYLNEVIEKYLNTNYSNLHFTLSCEDEPLGTGGAIKLAAGKASDENALVCNGDTFYQVDIDLLYKFHIQKKAVCSLNLKPMKNFDRYGAVDLNEDHSIKSFKEKQFYSEGLINGGVYALNIQDFLAEKFPEKFSFEKDYLEKKVKAPKKEHGIFGIIQNHYFIDIGIPEDYEKAQHELPLRQNNF